MPLPPGEMEIDFMAYLKGNAKIRAVIGRSKSTKEPEIYAGKVPQGVTYPFAAVTWFEDDGSQHMTGAGASIKARLQLDVYAKSPDDRVAVSAAFRRALDGVIQKTFGDTSFSSIFLKGKTDGEEDPIDGSEKDDYRRTMFFDVWYKRDVSTYL